MTQRIGIIGAGIAGLTAADWLSSAGYDVTVLEARDRAGGRILTLHSDLSESPIELGAEFIHGGTQDTWNAACNCPAFDPIEFPDRHWEFRDGELSENKKFWDDLGEVMEKMEQVNGDRSFEDFLRKVRGTPERKRSLAKDYVEGFHAAEVEKVSVVALEEAEESAEETNGQKQFRLRSGYSTIVDWFVEKLRRRDVKFRFNAIVNRIRWRPEAAEVFLEYADAPEALSFDAVVITLPLGVLQSKPWETGALQFEPKLNRKNELLAQLRMGNVIKLTLVFRERFLPHKVFGFIHAHDHQFPTWWTDKRQTTFVAWTGGPKADLFSGQSKEEMVDVALTELSAFSRIPTEELRTNLAESFVHNWREDPYSRGAYTYLPVGTTEVPDRLAEPVEDTLFFAGEALAPKGQEGTVHGAIASGKRAALSLLKNRKEQS